MFHSRNCGHCTAASQVMLNVASYFQSTNEKEDVFRTYSDNILFGRIDVTTNTLPWNVNFETLPAIVFYPAHR